MHPVLATVLQRLGLGLATLFAVSVIIFISIEMLPGDFGQAVLGQAALPETVAAFRKELGLDKPPHIRYFDWIAGVVQGLSEAINFGINAGLDIDKVMETISKGAAQSWQMENRYKTMVEDKFDYGFAVDWMRKDLKIVIEEAKRNGSPVPITEIVDEYYADVQKMGGNRWDSSSLIARLKKKK